MVRHTISLDRSQRPYIWHSRHGFAAIPLGSPSDSPVLVTDHTESLVPIMKSSMKKISANSAVPAALAGLVFGLLWIVGASGNAFSDEVDDARAATAARPNILYFYVDDMGWGSIGPNGQADRRAKGLPSVKTPNLDRLAKAGVNFTRGYGCFVCSPARSSQQTGFHQGHTFADRNDPDNAKKAIRTDDITMGDALAAAGYVTGYWGKWGYGGSKALDNPVVENVQTLPTSHGYQHVLTELHHVRAHTFFQPTLWQAPAKVAAKGGIELTPNRLTRYQNNPAYSNSPANQDHPDYPQTAYCDDSYAFAAMDFVRDQAKNYNENEQPFFGLLAVQIPHAPFDEIATLPNWNDAYVDDPHFASLPKQSQQWAAMVTRIDAHFGNILAALEDPNHDGDKSDSVADNTLVIFQSDNGGPAGSNNKSFDANGGLSGNKSKIEEGGIRVPLVMRWPSKIDADTTHDSPVDVTDLLPTFCELAGTETPLGIDGVSIAPTLTGTGLQQQREFLIHEASNGHSIIHGNYKLVQSLKKEKKKVSVGATKLFDLAKDPTESTDITAEQPELAKRLAELLTGERVNEPKGFANTYHHWTGKDGATMANADNLSDYQYANEGITYMTDPGPPQLSWVARINNTTDGPSTARADQDVQFLALAVKGKTETATQTLAVGNGVTLTARNELRLQPHSVLSIDGGSVKSLRQLSITPSATLVGHGSIKANVNNRGTIKVQKSGLTIDGTLNLAGTIAVDASMIEPGKSVVLIKATKVVGQFANVDNSDITIVYTPDSVIAKAK